MHFFGHPVSVGGNLKGRTRKQVLGHLGEFGLASFMLPKVIGKNVNGENEWEQKFRQEKKNSLKFNQPAY